MIRHSPIAALIALAACGAERGAVPAGGATRANQLAAIIEAKGCQLGPVRAAEARAEMGIGQSEFDVLIQQLVDQDRASIHSDGQIELMSEVCI